MRKIMAVWLCALLMLSSVFVVGSNVNEEIEGSDVVGVGPTYTPHAPIRIDSDADFPGIATAGDGSSGNPWIIEGWDINGTGAGYCLYIGNTTEHFVVRDCYLHEADGVNSWPYYPDSGLILYNAQNGTITDNNVESNDMGGIFPLESDYLNIDNNNLLDNYYGIVLYLNCENNTITSNTASNNDYGITLSMTYNTTVANNTLSSSLIIGMEVRDFSANNTITDNIITSSEFSGIALYGAKWNTFTNNTVADNTLTGHAAFYLRGAQNNTFHDNTAFNNDNGFQLYDASNFNIIRRNTISTNSLWGIHISSGLDGPSFGNQVYHNNFIDNTDQAFDEVSYANTWDNGYPSGGNYWSDYIGVDLNSTPTQDVPPPDGIGDVWYSQLSGQGIQGTFDNYDYYPLMAPWDSYPPKHSNEFPPPNSFTTDTTPTISVHVTDQDRMLINTDTMRFYVQGFSVFQNLTGIVNGYNVSYWHENGFSPGEVVTCRIVAEDLNGNLLDFTWNFTVIASFNIDLTAGWNLISFPVIPTNNSIESVLDSIAGSWDLVQYYDASDGTDHWKTYATSKPPALNDLQALDNTMSFWLHTTETCTLKINGTTEPYTLTFLKAGWNMVGYPTLTEKSITNALAGTGYDRPVETFNATAPYRIGPLADTYMMKPGEGYWVHVPADTVWVVDW